MTEKDALIQLSKENPEEAVRVIEKQYSNLFARRNYIATLRKDIISQQPSKHVEGAKEFNQASLSDQIKMQKQIKQIDPSTRSREEKVIAQLELIPAKIKRLKLSAQDAEDIRRFSETKLNERSQEVLLPTAQAVRNLVLKAERILFDAFSMTEIKSKAQAAEIVCALALCTGRRASELLGPVNSFHKPKDGPNLANFSGQLKTGLQAKTQYTIPLLAPLEHVKHAKELLQGRYPVAADANTEYLHKRFCRFLHESVQWVKQDLRDGSEPKMQREIEKRFHFHSLRELYACVTFEVFQSTYSMHGWIRLVLGHNELNVSKAYSNIRWRGLLKLRVLNMPETTVSAEQKLNSCLK